KEQCYRGDDDQGSNDTEEIAFIHRFKVVQMLKRPLGLPPREQQIERPGLGAGSTSSQKIERKT
ncbi:MAG TPA: hypothetical protein PK336_03560, partial [Methanoculleus sp.]|nr:hypothetical protein [Methanoculleus sp.]